MMTEQEYNLKMELKTAVEAKLFWAAIEAEELGTEQEATRIRSLHAKALAEWEKTCATPYLVTFDTRNYKNLSVVVNNRSALKADATPKGKVA